MDRKESRAMAHRWCAVAILLSLLLSPTLTTPTHAQGGTVVRLQPSAAQVGVGSTVSVEVVVENVTNLFGVEVHLVFDPTLLEVVDADAGMAGVQVSLGPFLSVDYTPQNVVDQGTGHIDFGYSQMPPETSRSGTGTIATITFRGKAAGISPLTFSSVILADPGGNPISATTQNGQVTVDGGVTVTPTATPTPPPGAVLMFSPQEPSVGVGETVQMVLRVENSSNLYGVEVHISHDAGINATNIAPGPCLADVVAVSSVAGDWIDYAASLQSPSQPVNGGCDLATVTIQGLTPGVHNLHFSSALLSDPDGAPLPVTAYDGSVIVTGGTPTPPTGCEDVLGYHVVQPGETVYAIGRAYQVRPDAIAFCSGLINPSRIYPGSWLTIPNVPWFPIPPGPIAQRQFGDVPTFPCRFYHTVQWGDTLFRISLQYDVSMWAIAQANTIYNLHYIQAGQVLCIP